MLGLWPPKRELPRYRSGSLFGGVEATLVCDLLATPATAAYRDHFSSFQLAEAKLVPRENFRSLMFRVVDREARAILSTSTHGHNFELCPTK